MQIEKTISHVTLWERWRLFLCAKIPNIVGKEEKF